MEHVSQCEQPVRADYKGSGKVGEEEEENKKKKLSRRVRQQMPALYQFHTLTPLVCGLPSSTALPATVLKFEGGGLKIELALPNPDKCPEPKSTTERLYTRKARHKVMYK